MSYPNQTFATIQQLLNYINTQYITNGNQDISGVVGNNILNSLATFIKQYTLNYSFATISSTTGSFSAQTPITIFTQQPSAFGWPNNVQNEYYFVNATGFNIPLADGYSYIDVYGTSQTSIPLRETIHIAKATNGNWMQVNNLTGSSGGGIPPMTGHAGQAFSNNGTSAFWTDNYIAITSADFEADGKTYLTTAIQFNHVDVFFNDLPRFIYNEPGNQEWDYVAGGIEILLPGFNANTNDYHLYIFKKGLTS